MKVLAYSETGEMQEAIRQSLTAGSQVVWLHELEQLEASFDWASARVLIMVAQHWPDRQLEALLEGFLPRPVVVLDQTAEGAWHNREPHPQVHLVDRKELADKLYFLTSAQVDNPPHMLGLFSSRNDSDAALLSICTAWSLRRQQQARVLVLDLAMPQADVAAYLDLPLHNNFADLVSGHLSIDKLERDRRDGTCLSDVDIIGLPPGSSLAQVTAEEVSRTLQALSTRYDHLVVNLNGMQPSPLLRLVARCCDQHWVLADQKHLSITAAIEMGEYLLQLGVRPGAVGLVLAPCYKDVLPDQHTISQHSSLPLRGILPWSPHYLTAINAGTLLPPQGELQGYLQALELMLHARKVERWWRKFSIRSA
ncbi:hypothetical protein QCD60_10730 [Pokkaliibacter sp. MBI-7]|uniref:AAA family ATPase n=1 Tax=Pokkaliibacter sp. MBI-7 TaxID=3040600 RepID=UPI00244AA422|nr:hypothetical protein [Pokkaliibacter sp. MBI-7]MDH2433043.1 hypothetical protein [Pokkaliibacter sp. MBI-7]